MSEIYYKWLLPNRITPIQNKRWPVRVKAWTAPEKRLVICRSGWHGVERKDILTHFPRHDDSELWTVEVRGDIIHGSDKFCATSMKLVERVAVPTREQHVHFALDVAESVLHIFEERNPNDRRVRQAIETTRAYVDGKATLQELRDAAAAAGAAARAAAYYTAAGDAARAAARAAWDAAWYAASAAYYAASANAAANAEKGHNEMFLERIGL